MSHEIDPQLAAQLDAADSREQTLPESGAAGPDELSAVIEETAEQTAGSDPESLESGAEW